MTATSNHGADDPRDEEPDDDGPTRAPTAAARECAQARDLAEHGHLKRAAKLYEHVLETAEGEDRARAALGLAVVRHSLDEPERAHRAATIAIDTRHPEFASRAAMHLAMSHEDRGEQHQARSAWQQVLALDSARYVATAHYGLARLAEEEGDQSQAREHWQQVLDVGDSTLVAEAALDYARRLLARGEVDTAEETLHQARYQQQETTAPLRLLSAAVHVERAIGELSEVLADSAPDPESGRSEHPETTATAVEVLARLVALNGDAANATEVWNRGLDHPDTAVSGEVRSRLRRGFLELDDESKEEETETEEARAAGSAQPPASTGAPWWDPFVEMAVASDSTPLLTGELFAAFSRMYVPLAAGHAAGESSSAALQRLLAEAVHTPSDYVWGRALHEDFRERMRHAAGSHTHVLPEGWPDTTS